MMGALHDFPVRHAELGSASIDSKVICKMQHQSLWTLKRVQGDEEGQRP